MYPILLRSVHSVTNIHYDKLSFGLNILFSFLAAWFLFRLARIDYPEKSALVVVTVFLFFPPAYFFLSGYPDVLFVFLAVMSLYFSRKRNWIGAGIAAGLLALTKPYGIFMWPVILIEYAWSHQWDFKTFLKRFDWLPLLLPIVFFGGFVLFNAVTFHNPMAFLEAQKTWGRSLENPASALLKEARNFLGSSALFSGAHFPYMVYVLSFLFSIVAITLSWSRVRKSYLLFSGLLLFSALLTGTLTSFGRYMLLGFPVLIGPSVYLSERKRLLSVYLFISCLALLLLAHLFVRCYPVE